MPSTLAKWFNNLRILQQCCQHPSCKTTLRAFAKLKPANLIADQQDYTVCIQGSGGPLILDGAFDKATFRGCLEFLQSPLTAAAVTFFFDLADVEPVNPQAAFSTLFPTEGARSRAFDAIVKDVADESFFPKTDAARQRFTAAVGKPGITVAEVAEAVFA
jgi:hypothetical protein